ncbi:MAG: type II secretion system protein [Candidatus Gracilibacteria bacterium]|nr:type II secretion system protein [Candidatus Peregrinibacteria bacterium]
MTNTKKGFTLIELLIVITIIGILAAALLPNILGAPARARDAARQADLNTFISALEAYAADTGSYPTTGGCVDTALSGLTAYFPGGSIPTDPSGLSSGQNCADDYTYCPSSDTNTSYYVAAGMEQPPNANYDTTTALADCTAGAVAMPTTAPGAGDVLVRIN